MAVNNNRTDPWIEISKLMSRVLIATIVLGTSLMIISLLYPMFTGIMLMGLGNTTQAANAVANIELADAATKNVLPYATALIGFAAGLVTALYGRSVSQQAANEANQNPLKQNSTG